MADREPRPHERKVIAHRGHVQSISEPGHGMGIRVATVAEATGCNQLEIGLTQPGLHTEPIGGTHAHEVALRLFKLKTACRRTDSASSYPGNGPTRGDSRV